MKTTLNEDHKYMARQEWGQVCLSQSLIWVLKKFPQKDLTILSC